MNYLDTGGCGFVGSNVAARLLERGGRVAVCDILARAGAEASLAMMRSLPEMTILSPTDRGETRACVRWHAEHPCPSYLRLGKAGEPDLHQVQGLEEGPLEIVRGLGRCALVSTGSLLRVALEAAQKLCAQGVHAGVFSCPWLQPVRPGFFRSLERFERLVVLEEHVAAGGLGLLLREHLPARIALTTLVCSPEVLSEVGTQEYLRRRTGLDSESVAAAALADNW
jgi:transketolase